MEQTREDRICGDSFCVLEERLEPAELGQKESVFTLGNGSLGFRGDFEEGYPGATEGIYINGFYETSPIRYGEIAYGYARNGQTMLNLANAKRVRIFLDEEEVCLARGEVQKYRRALCMRSGTLTREFEWRSPQGRKVHVRFERMVSLSMGDVGYICCEIEPLEGVKRLRIESAIDAQTANQSSGGDPRVGSCVERNALRTLKREAEEDRCLLVQATGNSALAYACAVRNHVEANVPVEAAWHSSGDEACCVYSCEAGRFILEKWIAYAHGATGEASALARRAQAQAARACKAGAAYLRQTQCLCLEKFWQNVGLELEGDAALLQGLRFSLFQVFQSVGRDGKTNASSKGLSGEGYEGHYFWDTETYIFPFCLYTMPDIARALLSYRYSILPQARARARELGHSTGALFPWRTINGEECSAYYPAGTAQYHINADIANAVVQYARVTADEAFMWECGVEILIETARLWLDLGFYSDEKGGLFCIEGVTGPDEYNVLVNNNCYTNLMAAMNMEQAAQWVAAMEQRVPERAERLFARIGLQREEPVLWRAAAGHMYLPYDEKKGIYLQDDAFCERLPWPIETIPKEHFPLLLHYHPLVIYRHQVCKQADLILALFLRGECFTLEQKRKIFDFYEPLTTHDSSLSKAVFSIVANEVGYREKAYRFFEGAARLDLEDGQGNSRDGLHMANMAGTWLSIVYGFAGMREKEQTLSFRPALPDAWKKLAFCVCFRGRRLQVSLEKNKTVYQLTEGLDLTILHHGERLRLIEGHPICAPSGPRRFGGVIFDLDGVLCHTDMFHFTAWKTACAKRKIPFNEEVNDRLRGVGRMESVERILEGTNMQLSEAEKTALAEEKNEEYRRMLERLSPEDLEPSARILLGTLQEKQIRIAIGSSSKNARMILKRLGLSDCFDAVVDGTMIHHSKPAPEVFSMAATALMLPPSQCLVVEDAQAGIQAARAGGFFSAGLGDAAKELANYPLQTLEDLTPLFEG